MLIKRYNFPYIFGIEGQGNHKMSRVYMSDYKTNYKLLNGLKKHNSLTTTDYTLIFGSSRGEKNREQLIELWRSGFKIGILRNGATSYKVANLSETEIEEDDIKINTVLKRKTHPYTLFFLDILKKYKNLSEKEFAKKVFAKGESGKISKSAIDQVHPTLRDLSVWNYTQNNDGSELTELGREILKENNEKITFICYRKDLNQDRVKMRLLWCILREIESDKKIPTYPDLNGHSAPFKINLEHLKKRYHGRGLGKIPKIPGTFGSLATIIILYFFFHILNLSSNLVLIGLIVIFILSFSAITNHIKDNENKDPKEIIIDEFIGQSIPIYLYEISHGTVKSADDAIIFYSLCFVLFRFFDIVKPFPVSFFDKNFKNSFGVIMDDVCAGFYVVLSLICFMVLNSYFV